MNQANLAKLKMKVKLDCSNTLVSLAIKMLYNRRTLRNQLRDFNGNQTPLEYNSKHFYDSNKSHQSNKWYIRLLYFKLLYLTEQTCFKPKTFSNFTQSFQKNNSLLSNCFCIDFVKIIFLSMLSNN